jgi:hypothetical protein
MQGRQNFPAKYFLFPICILSAVIATYVIYSNSTFCTTTIDTQPHDMVPVPNNPGTESSTQRSHETGETVNLVGNVDVMKIIANSPNGVCKDLALSSTSCKYAVNECPCAYRLPPEIDRGKKLGLKLSYVEPDVHTTLAEDYLALVRYTVLNNFYAEGLFTQTGQDYDKLPQMTMVGQMRLDNIQRLLEDAIARNVPGGFIEAGVWKGGSCAFGAAILKAYGKGDRKVFCADSFKGIPAPTADGNNGRPITNQDASSHSITVLNNNSREAVEANFKKLNLKATFIEGYFKPALYDADVGGMFDDGFMVVRLDGDTYQSTWQAIEVLYPRLHKGGYLIIDDYTDWDGCRDAIFDYRAKHNITEPILPVAHPEGIQVRGAWWRKET